MRKLLPILVMASLLAATACEEMYDPPPPPPPRWPDLTSPANVLRTVEASFNYRAIDYLKDGLSRNLVFYFDPNDVGQTPPGGKYVIPDSWTYTEFWQAVKNLLERAYSISLQLTTGGVGEPGPNETTYKAENLSLSLLVMTDELNGFLAQGPGTFEFEKYRNENEQDRWRLTKWWDGTEGEGGRVEPAPNVKRASVAEILAYYE